MAGVFDVGAGLVEPGARVREHGQCWRWERFVEIGAAHHEVGRGTVALKVHGQSCGAVDASTGGEDLH